MTYSAMTDRAHGERITETDYDTIVQNIQHLASMIGGANSAISALSAGATLNAPDYDSGWFAAAYNNDYTKAHGLGTTPRHVEAHHSAVASPAAGDEIVKVSVVSDSTSGFSSPISFDGTNCYFKAGDQSADGVVKSVARLSGSGYIRLMAWK